MILVLILILLILVEIMTFIHELGHFMVAKFNKATVVEFAIGFGPAIYQKKLGDTTYSLRCLPFGGYVAVLSDDIVHEIDKLKNMKLTPQQAVSLKRQLKGFDENIDWSKKPTIDKVSSPKKVWFALMGVTMNFFLLWGVLFVTYASAGKKMDTNKMYATPYIAMQSEPAPAPTTLLNPQASSESAVSLLPAYTDSKKNEPLHDVTNDVTPSFNSGEDYYEALINEINVMINANLSNDDLSNTDLQLTYDLPKDIEKDYNKKFTIKIKEKPITIEFDYSFTWSSANNETITFDNLRQTQLKNNKTNKQIGDLYWLYSSTPLDVKIIKDGTTIEKALPSFYLAIPVAFDESGKKPVGPVPYSQYDFGVATDYEDVNFGKSIYLSFVDSFIYLGKGFVMLFDFLTLGLVITPTTSYMYVNSVSMVAPVAGLWWGNLTLVMLIWMSYLMIVFNVLPFPPLDGWRVVEYSYEGIKKKKISPKTTSLMYKIGIGLFFFIIIGGILF